MKNEIWKDAKQFENYYQVSNYGRVKNKKTQRIIKGRINKKGYIHFALYINGKIKEMKAHRLVALTFIPNIENKPQVNHIDGNKQNNCVENLEWCTNGENQKHSYIINPNRGNVFKNNNPQKKKNML